MLEFTRIPGAIERISSHSWLMPEDGPDNVFHVDEGAVRDAVEEVLRTLAATERMIGSIRSALWNLEQRLS